MRTTRLSREKWQEERTKWPIRGECVILAVEHGVIDVARYVRTLALVAMAVLLLGVQGQMRILRPVAAGTWYPADPAELRSTVETYIDKAEATAPQGRCVALIVPHAGYHFSGDIAAHAFKLLDPAHYDRVIVLGPSHFAAFRGCSIPSVQACRTPLGDVLLDGPTIRKLDMCPLIDVRSVHYRENIERTQVHEREYCIEVLLPFLQVRLGAFHLVPMLVSDLKDYRGDIDVNAIDAVADTLSRVIDERTLIVISSDFTHYGNKFSYRPFTENVLEGIETLDRYAIDLILRKDFDGFRAFLRETRSTICGRMAICILLKLLPATAEGALLSYDLSARRTGDLRSSVSYAAIAFFDKGRPPARTVPVKRLELKRPE